MRWTEEHIKELREKYSYYINNRKEAKKYFKRKWCNIRTKASLLKITQKMMKINRKCSMFLGCHVAERVLSHVFKDVQKMSFNNKGFDFICNKGMKIDVKSSCLHKNNSYVFTINHNKIADYFLCIGFDNRDNLNPQHIWLIKSDDISNNGYKSKRMNKDTSTINIKSDSDSIEKFSKYELTDKLKETIECCNTLKEENLK